MVFQFIDLGFLEISVFIKSYCFIIQIMIQWFCLIDNSGDVYQVGVKDKQGFISSSFFQINFLGVAINSQSKSSVWGTRLFYLIDKRRFIEILPYSTLININGFIHFVCRFMYMNFLFFSLEFIQKYKLCWYNQYNLDYFYNDFLLGFVCRMVYNTVVSWVRYTKQH